MYKTLVHKKQVLRVVAMLTLPLLICAATVHAMSMVIPQPNI